MAMWTDTNPGDQRASEMIGVLIRREDTDADREGVT